MEPIYVQNFTVEDAWVDRYGRMKPSAILYLAQEMGGRHGALMSLDYDSLARRHLFWAITRHRVQVSRLPCWARPSGWRPGPCRPPGRLFPGA